MGALSTGQAFEGVEEVPGASACPGDGYGRTGGCGVDVHRAHQSHPGLWVVTARSCLRSPRSPGCGPQPGSGGVVRGTSALAPAAMTSGELVGEGRVASSEPDEAVASHRPVVAQRGKGHTCERERRLQFGDGLFAVVVGGVLAPLVPRSVSSPGSCCMSSGPTLVVGWTGCRKVQRPRDTGYGFQAVALDGSCHLAARCLTTTRPLIRSCGHLRVYR